MNKTASYIVLLCLGSILHLTLISCANKPNVQELNRLEEARKAAEAAEIQLEQLKKERLRLETQLAEQKKLLIKKQQEVNKAKSESP